MGELEKKLENVVIELANEKTKMMEEIAGEKTKIEKEIAELNDKIKLLNESKEQIKEEMDDFIDKNSGFFKDMQEEFVNKETEGVELQLEVENKQNELKVLEKKQQREQDQIKDKLENVKAEVIEELEKKQKIIDENRKTKINENLDDLKKEKAELEKQVGFNDLSKEEINALDSEQRREVLAGRERYLINKRRLSEIYPKIEILEALDGQEPKKRYLEIRSIIEGIRKDFTFENLEERSSSIKKEKAELAKAALKKEYEEAKIKSGIKEKLQQNKAKAQQEAKVKAEQEAKAKAQQEAKAKAQQEAKAKAQQEAKVKAEQEAKAKAQQEAKVKAEQEAKAKAQQEAKKEQEKNEEVEFGARENKKLSIRYDARNDNYVVKEGEREETVPGVMITEVSINDLAKYLEKDVEELANVDEKLLSLLCMYKFNVDTYIDFVNNPKKSKDVEILYDLKGLYDELESDEYPFSDKERWSLLKSANQAKKMGIAKVRKGPKVAMLEQVEKVVNGFKAMIEKSKIKKLNKGKDDGYENLVNADYLKSHEEDYKKEINEVHKKKKREERNKRKIKNEPKSRRGRTVTANRTNDRNKKHNKNLFKKIYEVDEKTQIKLLNTSKRMAKELNGEDKKTKRELIKASKKTKKEMKKAGMEYIDFDLDM